MPMKNRNFVFLLLVFFVVVLLDFMALHAFAVKFTHDFETGNLTGWTIIDGDAWDFQPTFGDNPTARNRGMASQHQGDWWIGGYEKYQGPDIGKKKGQVAGGIQGDGPMGILESIQFKITGEKISFMIAGGNHPWVEGGTGSTCVNLEIDGKMVRTATGTDTETLRKDSWVVSDLKGKMAVIRLYDKNASGWGHLNFDDINQIDSNGNEISWESLSVDRNGKLPISWGVIKNTY